MPAIVNPHEKTHWIFITVHVYFHERVEMGKLFLDYPQTVDYFFGRRHRGVKLGLDHIRTLLDRLHNPQKTFSSVHIAGTNGKGSTAAMTSAVLQAAGYATGLYTSPHLVDMRERIQIRNEPISKPELLSYLKSMQADIEGSGASFFEALTALAFCYFRDKEMDIAVVETGMGGRLDATNMLMPLCSVITEIGLDHTQILGRTLRLIAAEKAGIFKRGVPCIVGSRNKSVMAFFKERAGELGCPIRFAVTDIRFEKIVLGEEGSRADVFTPGHHYPDLYLNLAGAHQLDNLATTLCVIESLADQGWIIPETAIRSGLSSVHWPGRLHLLQKNPKILLDSAHNPMGIKRLIQALKSIFSYRRLVFVFGVLADKDYKKMLKKIIPVSDILIFTQPISERALPPDRLESLPELKGKQTITIPDVSEAWRTALKMAGPDDLICCAGSIYFVGELLKIHRQSLK